jgi:ketosteroid isomerase-like protein
MSAESAIRTTLATYERALNTSDVALATTCYTRDGIFMPTTLPTAQGTDLPAAYASIFDTIRLNVAFTIDELVVASDSIAYALTRSNGIQTILATGAESNESNREIFIFHVEDGTWKIARYLFNKPE